MVIKSQRKRAKMKKRKNKNYKKKKKKKNNEQMEINIQPSIATLNVNRVNAIQSKWLNGCKTRPIYMLPSRDSHQF